MAPGWLLKSRPMKVLGIETSCDDTGVAVFDSDRGLLAHRLFSQIQVHAEYGGVVPELASRDHVRKTLPLVRLVLADAGLETANLDGIAYTAGPGLVGALLVGAALGRSLAYALNIPAVGIHHMEAHLLSPMLEDQPPTFPFTALLVSGGHTLLASVEGLGRYQILGESLDDAVGEAFDKTAKALGLGYPGGPAIERVASAGDSTRFSFPRPMTERPGLDFSFSGLKTAVVTAIAKSPTDHSTHADLAASFQQAAIDTLVIKCLRALSETGHDQLVVAGGVSANGRLRSALDEAAKEKGVKVFYPRPAFSTDNGAMVAFAGWCRLAAKEKEPLPFNVRARWSIATLDHATRASLAR